MALTDPNRPIEAAAEDPLDALNLVNAGYVADLYEQYRRDPSSVDPSWREAFDSGRAGFQPVAASQPEANGTMAEPEAPVPKPAVAEPAPAAEPAVAASVPDGATPIKGPAARLAQNMAASLGVPTATSLRDVDVATLEARRRELNGQIAPRKVSFTHLIGWAIVRAASDQRSMSHYYTDADGQPFRVDPGAINLG